MRKLYYGLIIGFVLMFFMWTCVRSIFGSMCGNQVISQGLSPDKKYKFVVFVRDCGATTGFSTQVSVMTSDWKFRDDESGNVLTTSDRERGSRTNKLGGADVRVEWTANRRIKIYLENAAKTGIKLSKVKGIEIEYVSPL